MRLDDLLKLDNEKISKIEVRNILLNLIDKNVTVKILGADGYYYNDIQNEKFGYDYVVSYFEDLVKNNVYELWSIEQNEYNNVWVMELREI